MKRVLLSITGTVAGLVALLSFKTHTPLAGGTLPSAALPAGGSTASSGGGSGATTPPASGHSRAPAAKHSSSSSAATRTLVGQAVQTQYGVVQVEAMVQGTKITNVKYLQLTAYDGTSQQINSYAAPILLQQTLQAQNSHIDGVSGASYTSAGYVQSLQSALDQAGIQ